MTSTNLIFMGDELKQIAQVTLKKRKFHVPYQDFMLEHGHITKEEYELGQKTPCFTLVKDHGIYVMSGAANDKELWDAKAKKFKVAYAKGFDPDQEDLWEKTCCKWRRLCRSRTVDQGAIVKHCERATAQN